MNWKTVLTLVVIVPVLALFAGAGVLSWQVGQTWDARNTDSVIAGMIAVCASGALLMTMVLGLPIGIVMAVKIRDRQREQQGYYPPMPPQQPGRLPQWAAQAPQIADRQEGDWQRLPETNYDVWEEPARIEQHDQRW